MQNTELHVIDFKTQSIVATFQDQDYWDDVREWELKNNVDILEFKVFDGTRQSVTLQQQNIVLRQDRQGNVIPYTIEDEVEKTSSDRSITVRAVGSWTGLRKAGYIRPQKLEGLTAHQYVSLATKGTKWQPGNIAYASFRTMTLDEFTDPLTLLKKTATLFGLELNYRVEVDGSEIVGWYVDLVEKVGRVTRKEIELGKDLINVTRVEHTKNICTALIGFARGENNEVITIEKINNGSPYLVDNEAFQRWSENGQHKFGFYQPETEQDIDAKRLLSLMKTEMNKRKNSSVGYEVDALDIAEVFGLRHELIMKGDTIGIKDTAFTPALYLEARAIGGKESITNPDQNKYTFGEYHEIVDYDAEMRRMYNRVQGLLENKAGKPIVDQLNKLVKEQEKKMSEVVETNQRVTEITEKLQEMVEQNSVTIHDGPNPPTKDLREGKSLWLDTSNGKPGILKIWRNGQWEPVTEDFSGLEQQILDEVAKDVEGKTNQLNNSIADMNKRAKDLETKANGLETRAKNLETKTNTLNTEINGIKGNVESLDTITKEIKETEKGTQETINQLKINGEKVDQTILNISKSIDGVNTSISQIKKDAETTSKTVAQQQQTINGFSTSIQKLEANDKTTSETIAKQQQTLDGFTTEISNLKKADGAINETIAKQQQTLNGFTTEISNLKKKDGEIDQTIAKQQQTLDGFSTEISNLKKVDGEIKENATKQEQTINGLKTSITETNKNVTAQSQKINTVEQTANGNKTTIQNVQKDLTATKDNFNKVTTEIKTEAGKISTKLDKVEARTVGGENWFIHTGPNEKPETIGMASGAQTNKAKFAVQPGEYIVIECTDHTDSFYQFHLDNQKMGDFEKGKDMTVSLDMQNDVHVDFILFQFINGAWNESTQKGIPASSAWKRESWTFQIDTKATGWGLRIRFARNTTSVGKRLRMKKHKLEKGSIPTDFTKSTYELQQSVDGVTERITNTEKNQDTFKTQMTNIEKRATGIETNVKNLTNTTNNLGQRMSSSETKLKQVSDELSAKMTSKQVEDYVAGVGMINELRNADFKQGLKYFGQNGNKAVLDTSVKYNGLNSVKVSVTGMASDQWYGINQEVKASPGENIVLSGMFRSTDLGNGFVLELEYVNASGTRISVAQSVIVLKADGVWNRAVVKGVTPANTAKVRWKAWARRNGTFWIAQPMLQRGKVPSEFQLNPADISDVDALKEDIANRIATEQFNQKVTELQRSITANKEGINIKANKNEVYTKVQADGTFAKDTHVKSLEARIQVNEKNIGLSVKENNIISKINISKETILLDAKKINLIGAITAQHFQAQTIKGVKFQSFNAKDQTNHVEIFDSVIRSWGPLDKTRHVQDYAEIKEGGLFVYQVAENGSPFGDRKAYVEPARFNAVQGGNYSSALEPQELRFWVPNATATISYDVVSNGLNGYGLRLEAPEGILVKNKNGVNGAHLQFDTGGSIYFDGYGNIKGGLGTHSGSTWSIKDGDGRIKFITGIGKGSAQTTEYNSYGGGHAFNHNGTRLFAVWIQGANYIQQFGGKAIMKWQENAKRFEFRNANDTNWTNATAGAFQNASSLVWKKDIKNYEGSALELILKTDVMTYRYKNIETEPPFVDVDGKQTTSNAGIGEAYGPVRLGVISEFAPEIITDNNGTSVDLYGMISLSWKGIQENYHVTKDNENRLNNQEKVINDQEEVIKSQNDRISNLEMKLEQVLQLLGKE